MKEVKATLKKLTLNIASTLCLVLGILNLVLLKVVGISPAPMPNHPIISPLHTLILGVGFCVAGSGLRKKQRYAAILAIILVAWGIFPSMFQRDVELIAKISTILFTTIRILIITFIAINWKELK